MKERESSKEEASGSQCLISSSKSSRRSETEDLEAGQLKLPVVQVNQRQQKEVLS